MYINHPPQASAEATRGVHSPFLQFPLQHLRKLDTHVLLRQSQVTTAVSATPRPFRVRLLRCATCYGRSRLLVVHGGRVGNGFSPMLVWRVGLVAVMRVLVGGRLRELCHPQQLERRLACLFWDVTRVKAMQGIRKKVLYLRQKWVGCVSNQEESSAFANPLGKRVTIDQFPVDARGCLGQDGSTTRVPTFNNFEDVIHLSGEGPGFLNICVVS